MSAFRQPAPPPDDGPEPLTRGPATTCPACRSSRDVDSGCSAYPVRIGGRYTAKSALVEPRACTPAARVRLGWFRRCSTPSKHLHERCKVCGLEWLTAFAGGGS